MGLPASHTVVCALRKILASECPLIRLYNGLRNRIPEDPGFWVLQGQARVALVTSKEGSQHLLRHELLRHLQPGAEIDTNDIELLLQFGAIRAPFLGYAPQPTVHGHAPIQKGPLEPLELLHSPILAHLLAVAAIRTEPMRTRTDEILLQDGP